MPNKRNQHEAKPEQVAGFKGSYETSTRAHPKWRVGDAERAPLDLVDASPSPDLTGQWMDESFGFYLYVNHAGRHLELLLACVENTGSGKDSDVPRDTERSETRLIRMGGDLDDDDKVWLYLHQPGLPIDDKSMPCGHMRGDDSSIQLDLTSLMIQGSAGPEVRERIDRYATRRAKRLDHQPRLLPRHLVLDSVSHEFRSSYWFQPTPRQTARLPGFILGARVKVGSNYLSSESGAAKGFVDLVRDYFSLGDGILGKDLGAQQIAQRQTNLAERLDDLVLRAFHDARELSAEDGGIDVFGRDDWTYHSLQTLLHDKLLVDGLDSERSLYALAQMILDAQSGLPHASFEEHLYMSAAAGGNYYGAHIEFISIGENADVNAKRLRELLDRFGEKGRKLAKRLGRKLPAGAAIAALEVRKELDPDTVEDPDTHEPDWTGRYILIFAGLSGAKGIGGTNVAAMAGDGAAKNVYGQPWMPEQLEGPARLFDMGGEGNVGPWGLGAAVTFLSLYGPAPKHGQPRRPPLQINFSGLADAISAKWGASISGKRFAGWAYHVGDDVASIESSFDVPEHSIEYSGHSEHAPIHFPINGAAPEWNACALLEVLAANELAALSRDDCEVRVEGYADQPGSKIKNLILSRHRAMSVYNYVKSISYSRMKLGELSRVMSEKQELAAYQERKDDKVPPGDGLYEIETPRATSVTIAFHGEPPQADDKTEAYDSRFRRVDISINSARLHLRRMDDSTGPG